MRKITIGTRGSKLALVQAELVADKLKELDEETEVTLKVIKTSGDKFTDRPLSEVVLQQDERQATPVRHSLGDGGSDKRQLTGKGLFVKEIEEALLEGKIDIAVHSLKDLPAEIPDGLQLVAALEREDARDVLVSGGAKLAELKRGVKVGTCSPRRKAQLLAARKDLKVVPLRGNLDTRLKKVAQGEVDATVLAAAGLARMGWSDRASEVLDLHTFLPAATQGIIGLEGRRCDPAAEAGAKLNHGPSMLAALAERAFVRGVGADCHSAVAAYAVVEGEGMSLSVLVAAADGSKVMRMELAGKAADAEVLGKRLAERMLGEGAGDLLVLRA